MNDERLPDAELDVLSALWRNGESTARQVRESLAEVRPLAHASVVTLLRRLEKKGFLRRRKGPVGKAFLFEATRQPDGVGRGLVRDLLQRVFANDGLSLVASVLGFSTAEAQWLNYPTPGIPRLPDGTADLIFICNTWHHIADRVAYARRLKRDLAPGGRVVIVDFYKHNVPVGPPPPHKLTAAEVQTEFEAAGYRPTKRIDELLPYQYVLVFEPTN